MTEADGPSCCGLRRSLPRGERQRFDDLPKTSPPDIWGGIWFRNALADERTWEIAMETLRMQGLR